MACPFRVLICPSQIIQSSNVINVIVSKKEKPMTLWVGRFSTNLNDQAGQPNASLPVDRRWAIQEVEGSLAWARGLHRAGVLKDKKHAPIALGLDIIKKKFS